MSAPRTRSRRASAKPLNARLRPVEVIKAHRTTTVGKSPPTSSNRKTQCVDRIAAAMASALARKATVHRTNPTWSLTALLWSTRSRPPRRRLIVALSASRILVIATSMFNQTITWYSWWKRHSKSNQLAPPPTTTSRRPRPIISSPIGTHIGTSRKSQTGRIMYSVNPQSLRTATPFK